MTSSEFIQNTLKLGSSTARLYVLLLLLLSPAFVKAQRQKSTQNMIWVGHYSTIQLNEQFSVNSDIQLRTSDWVGRWSQQVVRSGISYKKNPRLSITLGAAWLRHAFYNSKGLNFRQERRPWQEVAYGAKGAKLSVMQRLRLEQRFIQQVVNGQKTNDYDQVMRLRYRLELQVPLKGPQVTFSLVNEFIVNPGYLGQEKFKDQNRTFAGLNIKMSPSTTLQAQYMKIFMWRTNNLLEDQNVLRFNIHQQFNRRK